MTRDYTELKIWETAHSLAIDLYRITREFPKDEQFGLVSQIRRAASSIGANIAEGCGQRTNASLRRFIFMSIGSAKELEYHLLLAKDLNYLSMTAYSVLSEKTKTLGKMLQSFAKNMPKT